MADLQRKIAPGAPPREHVVNFTRQRFQWIDAVAGEPRLPAAAKAIAVKLFVRHFNAEYGGCAWPSATKLAEEIGASERTARAALQQLAELGFLEVTPRARATSIYRMMLPASTAAEITPRAENADIATRGKTVKNQSVSEALPGSAFPPNCPEADFWPLPGDAAEGCPEVQRTFSRKPASHDSNIGIQSRDRSHSSNDHMRSDEHADDEHVLDDRQAEPTSTLMAAALRRLDEQHLDLDKPALDEPQTGEIAAAAPRGLAEASVETAPSPASMTAAERAEARKRLLERLAALDAAEPDSSRSTAECGSGNGAEGSETDPAATVTAEWDENVPAASADDLREPAEPSAGVERVAKAKGKAKAAKSPAGAFDRLWACYGRKVGKLAAERAFEAALRRGVDPETIIVAAERYAVAFDASGKEAQFRPHLSTWLNGGRYLDEDLPTSPSAGSGMIPADYQPTQDDIAAAFQRGIDVPMMRVAWPRFRDAVRSRSAPPADISAAWRNYCDRLAENMERQRQRDANRPGSIVTAVNELCAEIEGRKLKEVAPSAFGNPGGGLENLDFTGGEADMGKLDFSAGAIDLNATEYRDETRH